MATRESRYGPVDCSRRHGPLAVHGRTGDGECEATAEELVRMMERGALVLPEMQRRDEGSLDWRACAVPTKPQARALWRSPPTQDRGQAPGSAAGEHLGPGIGAAGEAPDGP